jgi:hypothetical protein
MAWTTLTRVTAGSCTPCLRVKRSKSRPASRNTSVPSPDRPRQPAPPESRPPPPPAPSAPASSATALRAGARRACHRVLAESALPRLSGRHASPLTRRVPRHSGGPEIPRFLTLACRPTATVRNLGPGPSESGFTTRRPASVRKLGVEREATPTVSACNPVRPACNPVPQPNETERLQSRRRTVTRPRANRRHRA